MTALGGPASSQPVQDLRAATLLQAARELRARTRALRSGHWFASVLWGFIVLGALPFYARRTPVAGTCHQFGDRVRCAAGLGLSPLGGAFNSSPAVPSLARWATVYWAIAIAVGFAVLVARYRYRGNVTGVRGRVWPVIAGGLGLLLALMVVNFGGSAAGPDFWIRGTSELVVVLLAMAMLAALERSRPFALFVLGFAGLTLLACLYTVINLFRTFGMALPFLGGNHDLPNLILPGAYLLIGGLGFLIGKRWVVKLRLNRFRV